MFSAAFRSAHNISYVATLEIRNRKKSGPDLTLHIGGREQYVFLFPDRQCTALCLRGRTRYFGLCFVWPCSALVVHRAQEIHVQIVISSTVRMAALLRHAGSVPLHHRRCERGSKQLPNFSELAQLRHHQHPDTSAHFRHHANLGFCCVQTGKIDHLRRGNWSG